MLSIIVAIAENNAIGKGNQLLWHLPEDMKRFKQLTTGHTVIMGRKTYESLPEKFRPLPNRRNVVITQSNISFEGCERVHSISEALEKMDPEQENFIIGGGEIYKAFLPFTDRLYLTVVNQAFEADTFFPEIDLTQWRELARESHSANGLSYDFIDLERIR